MEASTPATSASGGPMPFTTASISASAVLKLGTRWKPRPYVLIQLYPEQRRLYRRALDVLRLPPPLLRTHAPPPPLRSVSL